MARRTHTHRTLGPKAIRLGSAAALAGVLVAGAPHQARAADVSTSPARAVAFETRHLQNVQDNYVSMSGQILKGKPKQVLTITASLNTVMLTDSPQFLGVHAHLNGVPLFQPQAYATSCPLGHMCSVTGQWIIDLDQAEAANPGTIVGQPLDVEVIATDTFQNVVTTLDMAMVARMERKK